MDKVKPLKYRLKWLYLTPHQGLCIQKVTFLTSLGHSTWTAIKINTIFVVTCDQTIYKTFEKLKFFLPLTEHWLLPCLFICHAKSASHVIKLSLNCFSDIKGCSHFIPTLHECSLARFPSAQPGATPCKTPWRSSSGQSAIMWNCTFVIIRKTLFSDVSTLVFLIVLKKKKKSTKTPN